jgi:large conductance mechanosensitive channel
MLDLAVGVLIGSAFSGLVTSLTNNIIQPLLNCFGAEDATSGVGNLAIKFGKLNMPIGQFLADVINFIIMAFVIFLIVKGVNKLSSIGKKKEEEPEEPTTKVCPFCASEIPIAACKCPHCTSDLPAIEVVKEEEKEKKPAGKSRK